LKIQQIRCRPLAYLRSRSTSLSSVSLLQPGEQREIRTNEAERSGRGSCSKSPCGDAWDESHEPEGPPRCFGGTKTGVAHRACNRRHGAEVVRPLDAKATRNRQKHIGAFQTRHKLPGGRMDWRKRKVDGCVVARY
jgi:hypothetical protein